MTNIQSRDSGSIHSFYLVARPIRPSARSSRPSPSRTPIPPSPIATQPTPQSTNHQQFSRTHQALLDTTHYLLFITRHHLCHLLGYPPLKWEDTVPPPLYTQEKAELAVKSVIKGLAFELSSREEGWEVWEKVFVEYEHVLSGFEGQETIASAEEDIKSLWSARVGRRWSESDEGETVVVEFE